MRVLHVNDFPLETGGGAEVLLARTLTLLQAEGVTTDVFTAADLLDGRLTASRYIDNPVARRALAERLRTFRPDVVHLHNYYHVLSPGILAELGRYQREHALRIIMTAHDYHLVCPNSGGNFYCGPRDLQPIDPERLSSLGYLATRRWDARGLAYSLLKLTQFVWNYRWLQRQRIIDTVICPSRFLETLVRPTVRASCVVPHPVPSQSAPTAARPGPLRLVFAGRLEPEKGLCEFLEMLPASFAGTLEVIGSGREAERCQAACRRRGLEARALFLGRLPHPQTLERIGAAHVLVLPSRCLESYGLTIIEALAAGTNVLASDRGAMRELVGDAGAGYLFDPEDPASLALALERIDDAHQAGTLNDFDVSTFLCERSPRAYVEELIRLYQPLAASRGLSVGRT